MKLIFASNNQYKVEEMRSLLGDAFDFQSMNEAGIDLEIPEPHDTLEKNASEKSHAIFRMTGMDCFSEDTGLEVDILNGKPGVKSARYADEGSFDPSTLQPFDKLRAQDSGLRTFEKNMDKLLNELKNKHNRKARFRTIISLIIEGKETQFEGISEGSITWEKSGTKGFGYDPVFLPTGSKKTFAEMELSEKNLFSHRRKATEKMVAFLKDKLNKEKILKSNSKS
jgi:XTP/dITP diphosphohydrolase